MAVRTRFWNKPDASTNTCVQVRDDADPMVYLHSNIGWIPIGNSPKTYEEAEVFAKTMADGYGLTEGSAEQAQYMLGEGDEDA